MSAFHSLPPPLTTGLPLLMVLAVVALVAWALQLMQAANDRQEFSLMLAGCMVCSAAVGLATVMVITFTAPDRLQAIDGAFGREAGVSLDSILLPDQLTEAGPDQFNGRLPASLLLPWDGPL